MKGQIPGSHMQASIQSGSHKQRLTRPHRLSDSRMQDSPTAREDPRLNIFECTGVNLVTLHALKS